MMILLTGAMKKFPRNKNRPFAFGDLLGCNLRCSLNVHTPVASLRSPVGPRIPFKRERPEDEGNARAEAPDILSFMSCPTRRQTGFTLVELILVVFILSIIAGLTMPNFSHMYEGIQLKKAAEDLAYMMRYAQSRAIIKNKELRLEFDSAQSKFWLTQESESSRADSQPEGRAFKKVSGRLGQIRTLPQKIIFNTGSPTVSFYPDGRVDQVSVSMCLKEHCFIVSTKEQRGRVRLFETTQE